MAGVPPGASEERDRRGFVAVDTIWLQRLDVLFFIELDSRRVHVAGGTDHPDEAWITQQARQVA